MRPSFSADSLTLMVDVPRNNVRDWTLIRAFKKRALMKKPLKSLKIVLKEVMGNSIQWLLLLRSVVASKRTSACDVLWGNSGSDGVQGPCAVITSLLKRVHCSLEEATVMRLCRRQVGILSVTLLKVNVRETGVKIFQIPHIDFHVVTV